MNWADWYTDRADVWRVVSESSGALTRQVRKQLQADVPCRIFQEAEKPLNMTGQAAEVQQASSLACANEVDIRPGDELIIHPGGGLGRAAFALRAFAGEPQYFFEPFGAVIPGLAHQEIRLLQQERVD